MPGAPLRNLYSTVHIFSASFARRKEENRTVVYSKWGLTEPLGISSKGIKAFLLLPGEKSSGGEWREGKFGSTCDCLCSALRCWQVKGLFQLQHSDLRSSTHYPYFFLFSVSASFPFILRLKHRGVETLQSATHWTDWNEDFLMKFYDLIPREKKN